MSDRFPSDPDQDETPLAPDLARLHALLLREGEHWRQNEPSTARLERHVQALAERGAAHHHNGHDREDRMLAERNPVTPLPTHLDGPTWPGARPRGRGLLPAVAAVLLIALAGSIFALFGTHHAGPGRATTHNATTTPVNSHVTAVRPQDTRLPLPASGFLSGISFSSAHDGWAVGGLDGPASAGRHTVLIHYHDGVWTASSDTIPNASLYDVSMDSADDGWAWGTTESPTGMIGGGTVFLLHYTGGHWQRVDSPALQATGLLGSTGIRAFRMLSPDFGYLTAFVDVVGPGSNPGVTRWLLLVYQHGAWTSIPNTIELNGSAGNAAMVSPSEGWVTSETADGTSAFYHYLNGVWTKTATYPGLLYTMQMVTARDIWAAGVNCVTRAQCQPAVYHFDGVSWAPVTAPDVTGLDWTNLGWVALTADTADVVWYSVIDSGSARQFGFFAYAHGAWSSVDLPVNDYGVLALTTDGNGGTWAIVHSTAPQFDVTVVYTSGSTWSVYGHS